MISSTVLMCPSSTESLDLLESADVSLGFSEKYSVMFPTEPLSLDIEGIGGEGNVALMTRLVKGKGDKPPE